MITVETCMSSWKLVSEAPKGIGQVLLRAGSGPLDPAFVGYQAEDGRWFSGDSEAHPTHFSLIPAFDCDDGAAS